MRIASFPPAAHAAYFSMFEASKIFLGADKQGHHPIKAAACGAIAALSHDIFMTPFDTVKQRMQIADNPYKCMLDCIKTVTRREGFSALYVSFPTTLMMNIPNGCIFVTVNESAKKILNPQGKYNFSASMISGCFAGAVAAALTTPLDVIKTRLQTRGIEPICPETFENPLKVGFLCDPRPIEVTNSNSQTRIPPGGNSNSNIVSRMNSIQTANEIFREYGYRGFMRGLTPRVLLNAPSAAVSWTVYEFIKSRLTDK